MRRPVEKTVYFNQYYSNSSIGGGQITVNSMKSQPKVLITTAQCRFLMARHIATGMIGDT
jgi:hypothetical protein